MNKNTLGSLAVVLVGVAAFGTMLAISEQPTSCPCYSSSSPNPWYPCLHNPCPKETLSIQSYRINTPTNLTLNIFNPGASPKALIAYYVKDSTGAQYANSNWPGPTIPPAIDLILSRAVSRGYPQRRQASRFRQRSVINADSSYLPIANL